MLALVHAMDQLEVSQSQFMILSFGTGQKANYFETGSGQMGIQQWMFDPVHPAALLNAVFDSCSEAAVYQCTRLLEDRYSRLNPRVSTSLHSFDKKSILMQKELYREIAENTDITSTTNWLKNHNWVKKPTNKPALNT